MTRFMRSLVTILLIGVLAAPALAQELLGTRVSIDLKGMAPADAFKVLADAVGMRVAVDQAVTAPVDILVRNVTAKTALTTICESIGCRWTVADGAIAVKPAPNVVWSVREGRGERTGTQERARVDTRVKSIERIRAALARQLPADMTFENTPLKTVNERLSAVLDLKLTITNENADVQTLTVDMGNQTLQSGLRLLAEHAGSDKPWRIVIKDPATEGELDTGISIMFSGKTPVRKKK